MLLKHSKFIISALLVSTIVAACGGADSSSRERNVKLEGKEQCLSDEATTIDANGMVQLAFCNEATAYEIWEGADTVVTKKSIVPNSMNYFQAPTGAHSFRVLSFTDDSRQVGDDVVSTTNRSDAPCSSGGPCGVGDTGPGNGIVFYATKTLQPWGQYMEMARAGWYDKTEASSSPSADPSFKIGCDFTEVGTSSALGAGKVNTEKFISSCPVDESAAYTVVDKYSSGTVDDWIIPTTMDIWEISLIETMPDLLGLNSHLAASNEGEVNPARGMDFFMERILRNKGMEIGSVGKGTKTYPLPLRPVRYFAAIPNTVSILGALDVSTTTTAITSPSDAIVEVQGSTTTADTETMPTTANARDCSEAPSVKFPKTNTTDDVVGIVLHHPCLGKYPLQTLLFGPGQGVQYSMRITGESWGRRARFDAGTYTFSFQLRFATDEETAFSTDGIMSERKEISFTVSKGTETTSNVCTNDNVLLEKNILTMSCPLITGTMLRDDSEMIYYVAEFAADNNSVSFDLSKMEPGWHYLRMSIGYGLSFYDNKFALCLTECDIPTSFDPFSVSINGDSARVSATLTCSGYTEVLQTYKVSNNLYMTSELVEISDLNGSDVALRESTSALMIQRWCEKDGKSGITTNFAGLIRNASTPSSDDAVPKVDEKIATVNLPQITGGATDLPVGEVANGLVTASSTAESLVIAPNVVRELLGVTIDGSPVRKVEVSTDGIKWNDAHVARVVLDKTATTMSVRLTAENGTQTVINKEIVRSVPTESSTPNSSDSSMNLMSYWWILLILFALIGAGFAFKRTNS